MHAQARNHEQDQVLPFLVDRLNVRGRIVRLGQSLDHVLARHDYPPPVSRLVGQAAALTVMLANAVKLDGRLTLQAQTEGLVSLLVVDVQRHNGSPPTYRVMAKFDKAQAEALLDDPACDPGALLGAGALAVTIDQKDRSKRYQGIVEVTGGSLEKTAENYFSQSEQIPTRIRLAVSEVISRSPNGAARHAWQASGIMAQFLPQKTPRQEDWIEAKALLNTLSYGELADPGLSCERLLYRLFHERGVHVFAPVCVGEACSCTRAKVEAMLMSLGEEALAESLTPAGDIEVTCQFCNRLWRFDPAYLKSR